MSRPKRRFALSTTHIIMLSFLVTVLIGSVLLVLPVSSADGSSVPYVDALFTATTATCVTGLVTLPTATTWSTFGHVVILLLIQIGGLGVITVIAGFALAVNRRMGISNRLLLQDAFNLNSLEGLASFLKKVIIGTFLAEGAGALLYMMVFVPEFGARGIWISVFNAVSCFCNAGIDIIGLTSLEAYATHPLINAVTCVLIILGGLGYIVWWDLARVARLCIRTRKLRSLRDLSLHSKMALTSTAVLIFGGGLLIYLFERNNPLTIGNLSLFDQIQVSLFQSVTTRTAGFASIPQQNLTSGSVLTSLVLMFIGGSPVGTAGGVKTVTVLTLLASAACTIRGRHEVTVFHRSLHPDLRRKAVAVVVTSLLIVLLSTLLLTAVEDAPLDRLLYETVSATATVGLTRDLTPHLSTAGRLIITVTMYLGRVGPISLAFAFQMKKETPNIIKHPTEPVSIG